MLCTIGIKYFIPIEQSIYRLNRKLQSHKPFYVNTRNGHLDRELLSRKPARSLMSLTSFH